MSLFPHSSALSRRRPRFLPLLLLLLAGLSSARARADADADFALKDGDTVVFLGDSITAARGYPKIVEHYTLMRFPERHVRFVNAGQGGDTAHGSLERLERDVFAEHPTVLTVAFGINDIGWGTKADDEHKQLYLDGIRSIVEQCRQRGIRPYICSPAITAELSDRAEQGYLQKMTDEGLALARSLGAETIDLQRGMREIQRRIESANATEADPAKQTRLHVADGVHLNELGQLAMGYAMLKGLGAPAEVSAAVLDVADPAKTEDQGCRISEVKVGEDGLSFTRLDAGLPLNLGPLSGLNYRWIPLPEQLNAYRLTVRHLPPGDYSIRAAGRELGKASAGSLEKGLEISSMTADGWQPGGPWDAQSVVVKELVDARDLAWMAAKRQRETLSSHPAQAELLAKLRAEEDAIVIRQREIAKPFPYRFEIRKVKMTKNQND